MSKTNIIDEYFDYHNEYTKRYGINTLISMQVGSFFESYATDVEGFELQRIADMFNFVVTKKDKSVKETTRKNPYLIGFPTIALQKYLRILMDNGITVVLIEQVTPPPNPKREITNIYSPATYIDEIITPDNNFLVSVYIEEVGLNIFICGASLIDISTGRLLVFQTFSNNNDELIALDEIVKLFQSYNCKEILITTHNLQSYSKDKLLAYLEIVNKIIYYKTLDETKKQKGSNLIEKIVYQKEILDKIYKGKTIEDFDLETWQHCRISLMILFNYIYAHNPNLLNNISHPNIIDKQQYLYLGNNALYQLNIFNNDEKNISNIYNNNVNIRSLFDIINRTKTAMGRRYLKNQLICPLINKENINDRYKMIKYIIKNDQFKNNNDLLKNIPDIERMLRKISIGNIHPIDMFNYINGIKYAYNMIYYIDIKNEKYGKIKNTILTKIYEYINILNNTFNYDELGKYLINDITGGIFKTGLYLNIDQLLEEKKIFQEYIYVLCDSFNKLLNELVPKKKQKKLDNDNEEDDLLVKVEYNDRDKYHLSMTKRRAELLQYYFITEKKSITINKLIITKDEFTFNMNPKGNTCKIFIPDMQEKSLHMAELDDKIKIMIKNEYVNWLLDSYNKWKNELKQLIDYVAYIDFINNGAEVACYNNFCCPEIINKYNNKSYLNAKDMRHPIAEKLLIDSVYIPISIDLGTEEKDGILLFGLNSVGKSTLQKSIGINIILSQIGYYVAAKSFIYYPYQSLMTRITANDNIFKGLSSFALEMSEIKAILKRSTQNTLIIADEVCKGTEHQSSLIIVMAMLEILAKYKCSFITATHLHDICNFDRLKQLNNVKLFHLHVDYNENTNIIKYGRQLLEGSGSSFYGLYVAKHLINDSEFLQITNEIKTEVYPDILISDKISKYNKNLIVDHCMICNYRPINEMDKPLETHHIIFQKMANEYGFIDDIHKNHKSNLCILCSKCHDEVDRCNIIIYGYKNNKLIYITNKIIDKYCIKYIKK